MENRSLIPIAATQRRQEHPLTDADGLSDARAIADRHRSALAAWNDDGIHCNDWGMRHCIADPSTGEPRGHVEVDYT